MPKSPPIFVTKTFVPPLEEYEAFISASFQKAHLTNQGPLVVELEKKLRAKLGVDNLQLVANGTVALQLALKALNIESGEVITTPFSYVATISSILWERCQPVFVDIEPDNFTLNPALLEKAITPRTRAIMPVHVFGYACNVEAIQKIAVRHGLKVIYDAAHAFGCRYKDRSLLDWGDVSTCSFHATKLFHTGEGGACLVQDANTNEKLDLIKRFGHSGDEHFRLGINAKMSELHAGMGLAVLPYLPEIIKARREISELYDRLLCNLVGRPLPQDGLDYNYAYYPVLFRDETQLLRIFDALAVQNIYPRRYFYPALNKLPYLTDMTSCFVAEDVSSRIACLPLFPDLSIDDVCRICRTIEANL
ncbi:MAG: DegT/DnrJ/EryC1/StrS family aminotransferase [Rhodospirillaceae bacterium]|nr:DegT/DnrJ/EryC1/StrS family aminotransferase [Rhodospirillaceae bacterium]